MDPLALVARNAAGIPLSCPTVHPSASSSCAALWVPSRCAVGSVRKLSSVPRAVSENVSQLDAVSMPNNDDGCWWLMSGFSAPDSGLPPQVPPARPFSPPPRHDNRNGSRHASASSNSLLSDPEPQPSTSELGPENGVADNGTTLVDVPEVDSEEEAREGEEESRSGSDSEVETDSIRRGDKKRTPVRKPISEHSHLGGTGLRVAYQGVPGAYSEAAVMKAYPNCDPVPCETFDTTFVALSLWIADRAVLPIENSLGGSIHRNFDLMLEHRLHIVGEVQMVINHCLCALKGTKLEELKQVHSHPQALSQCEMRLRELGVTTQNSVDTAGAAQMVSQQHLRNTGAIASKRAAEIYDLEVLVEGIQDDDENITRFLVLSREPIIPKLNRPWKTSIVFTLEIGPGNLSQALQVFASRKINLTKIESRPLKKSQGELLANPLQPNPFMEEASRKGIHVFDYLFYVDLEASMAEPRAQNALRHLQEFARYLRVLGSYPMDVSPMANL